MLPSTTTLDHRRRGAVPAQAAAAGGWLAPLLLAAAAGLLYAVNLDRLPQADELHHALAARGLLEHGTPAIAEGVYTRGLLYTWAVAGAYALLGDGLAAARLPALLCVALLVGLMFAWLRREAGPLAAWLGAGLFAVSPFAVEIAQFARFYGPQCLTLFLGAALLHAAALERPPGSRRQLLLGAAALPPLLLAVYFQPTSLIGMVGLGLWAAGAVALPWLRDPAVPGRRKLLTVLGLAAAALAAFALLWAGGILADLWRRYRWTPLFNRDTQDQFWFYHAWYSLLYPTLWPLTGVLALVALAARPRPAAFLLVLFAPAFLISSNAAAKALRYFAYAQPFLFALWGIGLAALWPRLRDGFLPGLRAGLGGRLADGLGAGVGRPLAAVLLAGALLFLLLANPFWLRSATMLADVAVPPERPQADWPRARPALEPWLARADVVVTTEELATLYFLGRYDLRFSRSKLDELPDDQQREFGIDDRTGRPVISTRESMARILACYPVGVVLGPIESWENPKLIDRDTARLVEERAAAIPLPPGGRMFAYGWDRPAAAPAAAADPACAGLPRFDRRTGATLPPPS